MPLIEPLGGTMNRRGAIIVVVAFYALACGLSWWAYGQASDAPALSMQDLLSDPYKLLAKFGPTIAGLALMPFAWRAVREHSKPGQVSTRAAWLIGAGLVFPLIVTAIAAFAGNATSGGGSSVFSAQHASEALNWIGLRTFLGGGLGEEIGFRGLALPLLLLLMGPRAASLVLGIAWGLWHYPVLAEAGPAIWVAQLLLTVSLSLIFTFAYLRSGGQLSLMVLLHGAINGWADFFEKSLLPQIDDNIVWQGGRILLFAAVAIGLCCLRWRAAPIRTAS